MSKTKYTFNLSAASQAAITMAREALETAAETLADEVGNHRAEWDEHDEDWQESQHGQAVESWLIELDTATENMGDLAATLEEVDNAPSD